MTTIIYPGPYDVTHYEVYSRTGTTGDNLSNYLLDGQRYRMTAGGQHGHGLFLGGVTSAQYSNIDAVDCHGDGIYVGSTDPDGTPIGPSSNVLLQDIEVRNALRHGISVIGATGVTIDNYRIVGSNGSFPMSGVNLQPTPDIPNSGITLRNGRVEGCRTSESSAIRTTRRTW